MRTEKEVKQELKQARKSLKIVKKNFEETDCSDSMHDIPICEERVNTLLWVLGKS